MRTRRAAAPSKRLALIDVEFLKILADSTVVSGVDFCRFGPLRVRGAELRRNHVEYPCKVRSYGLYVHGPGGQEVLLDALRGRKGHDDVVVPLRTSRM